MRIIETVSFGEKRFVSVVQVDKQQFLFGGGPATVALLAQLSATESFGEVFQEAKANGKALPKNSKTHSGADA
jgi:flagellar biogenesis protein FliO